MDKVYVSTVTPVYQGEGYLEELVTRLERMRSALDESAAPVELLEAIFVTDSPIDGSAALLAKLQATRPWVKVVELSRNFGQHPATVAGILHSSGDWVATLDEDLQHPPALVQRMLVEAARAGKDVIYVQGTGAVMRSAFRNFASRAVKNALVWATAEPAMRRISSFRLIRGSIARAAAAVASHDTYFDVVLHWFTDRIGWLSAPLVDPRSYGSARSGYSLRSLLSHARRALMASQIKPLRAGAAVGLFTLVLSVVLAAVTLLVKLTRPELVQVRGWTSLMLATLFFGGLSTFLVGVALEFLSTVLLHVHGRPTFFVVDRSKDELVQGLREG